MMRKGLPGILIKIDIAKIDRVISDVRLAPSMFGISDSCGGSSGLVVDWWLVDLLWPSFSTGTALISRPTSQSSKSKLLEC